MTRLEELSHEIREKQDELNDLVDELRGLKKDSPELDCDENVNREIPLAFYVSIREKEEIDTMTSHYHDETGIKISRSDLVRRLCMYYLRNYDDIDLSFY